jgi:hypothetical protein
MGQVLLCFEVLFFIPKMLPKSGLIHEIPITGAAAKGQCMSILLMVGESCFTGKPSIAYLAGLRIRSNLGYRR